MMTGIEAHPNTWERCCKKLQKQLVELMVVSHDDYVIHELHPGNLKQRPLLAEGHIVMGLFKKNKNGEPKGRWGLQKANGAPKGRCGHQKG
jgi:hypothetical protein